MKIYKYIRVCRRKALGLRRKAVSRTRAILVRSRASKVVRKYLKMEAGEVILTALRYVRKQIAVRPRLILAAKVVLVLAILLAASTQASQILADRKGDIKVRGQAVLVAEAGRPTDEVAEIRSVVDSKLSPFAYVNPVEDGLVSQGFHSYHRAMDIATGFGSSIKPIGSGTVEFAGFSADGKGNIVIVNHGDGLKTLYAHMGKISVGVGNNVDPETVLGTVGLTGRTTGAHLHLEVYDGGVAMNPVSVLP